MNTRKKKKPNPEASHGGDSEKEKKKKSIAESIRNPNGRQGSVVAAQDDN
jgi:hypothetical protein